MTILSLYTHRCTILKTYLNRHYTGGTLNFYPARLSKFFHFSAATEGRIVTVFQKVLTFFIVDQNVQNFNDSCSQSVLIEIKYSSIKINFF
jgi:hypothetical protein